MCNLVCAFINVQNILPAIPKTPVKSLRIYEYSKEELSMCISS